MPDAASVQGVILAFDFGTRQIGIASGQTVTASASPLTVLPARDGIPDWSRLEALIEEWRPALLLVGLPLNMDGSDSPLCARARKFARRLHGRTGRQVLMVDERLSTREAKRLDRGLEKQRGSQSYRERPVDAIAASLVLETWLSSPELASPP